MAFTTTMPDEIVGGWLLLGIFQEDFEEWFKDEMQ